MTPKQTFQLKNRFCAIKIYNQQGFNYCAEIIEHNLIENQKTVYYTDVRTHNPIKNQQTVPEQKPFKQTTKRLFNRCS